MSKNLKAPVLSAVAFFWTLGILSVGYSAYVWLSSVTSGQPLTVGMWTQVKDNFTELDARTAWISSSGNKVGIGTSSPTEKLEVNGNLKFTSNGSIISKAPRVVRSSDPGSGCPPTRAANTDLWTMPITLDRPSTVFLSGDSIKNLSVRADLQLYLDGSMLAQTISPPSSDWVGGHVQWSGTIAAWSHTVSVRSPQANAWGCWVTWGNMEALIFEN